MPKFKLKKQRLLAIFDAYRRRVDNRPVTMREVSEWAIGSGLLPVPGRGCGEADAEEWERQLDEAEKGH